MRMREADEKDYTQCTVHMSLCVCVCNRLQLGT